MADEVSQPPRRSRNRRSRSKGLRKTTGCQTCRKRHIKCDEGKPDCERCVKGGQTCTYSTGGSNTSVRTERRSSQVIRNDTQPRAIQSPAICSPSHATNVVDQYRASIQNNFVLSESNNLPSDIDSGQVLTPETLSGSSNRQTLSIISDDNSIIRTVSSQPAFNVAVAKWFDLLAGDATFDGDQSVFPGSMEDLSVPDSSYSPGFDQVTLMRPRSGSNNTSYGGDLVPTSNPHLLERRALSYGAAALEKQQWQSPEPIELLPQERHLLRNFVHRISPWIDLFDASRNFQTFVPHLAIHNTGLMKALLALSARHVSLNPDIANGQVNDRNDALQYYNETLHYLSTAMQYDTYKTSLELLATALIVSAYEMLDGSGKDWERHLQGVFWIQRSQVIHGDSKGLKQAVWWAWLCQDVWAAYREKRKTFTFWKPTRSYNELQPFELAARSVYLTAQVVNYCSGEELEASNGDIDSRIAKADHLTGMLDEWQRYLTVEFMPLPFMERVDEQDEFKPIWINIPTFGVSLQLHYSARILLLLNRPSRGGFGDYLERSRLVAKYVAQICGIGMTLVDNASSIMSSQCLFIAGLCCQEKQQRDAIVKLIDACRQRTGWPVKSLSDELQEVFGAA